MGFLDTVRSWFATESAEARAVGRDTRNRLEADLDRREAELTASPSEKLDMLQQDIAQSDAVFEELRDKVEGRTARADAIDELESPPDEGEPTEAARPPDRAGEAGDDEAGGDEVGAAD